MAADFHHPTWRTALSVAGGYLAVLVAMFLVLFVLPYLAFVAL